MPYFQNDLFSLSIYYNTTNTKIVMALFTPIVNTGYIPQTYKILKKYLPSILRSKCFNKYNYPFRKEVKQTEIGHLLEHILLENICLLKKELGLRNPIHNGLTEWNWKKEPGIFFINIDASYKDKDVFVKALDKSIFLLLYIFQTAPQIKSNFLRLS